MSMKTTMGLALAITAALAPQEPTYRPPQRKVGSTNPNKRRQKAQRKARKASR